MAWGSEIPMGSYDPAVKFDPTTWGNLGSEMRKRDYNKDVASARDLANRRYKQALAEAEAGNRKPLEDELETLKKEVSDLKATPDEAQETRAHEQSETPSQEQEETLFEAKQGPGASAYQDMGSRSGAANGPSDYQENYNFQGHAPVEDPSVNPGGIYREGEKTRVFESKPGEGASAYPGTGSRGVSTINPGVAPTELDGMVNLFGSERAGSRSGAQPRMGGYGDQTPQNVESYIPPFDLNTGDPLAFNPAYVPKKLKTKQPLDVPLFGGK